MNMVILKSTENHTNLLNYCLAMKLENELVHCVFYVGYGLVLWLSRNKALWHKCRLLYFQGTSAEPQK